MLYTDYYKRMSSVMSTGRAIKKYRIPIIIFAVLIVAVVTTLLATRGLVYDKKDCPAQVVYGQELEYSASAFLDGNVGYEYRAEGDTNWSKTRPTSAGVYYVRAVSSDVFGSLRYGKTHKFTIVPKSVEVIVNDSVVYGENPGVTVATEHGDSAVCTEYKYTDLSQTSTTVSAVASAVVITDKNGNDVTDCYKLTTPDCPISFTKRSIGITVADKTAVYENKIITFGGYELTRGTLADGDALVLVSAETLTDVGEVKVNPTFSVLNPDGINVTANYDISQNTGTLTVTQRPLLIASHDGEHEYNDKAFSELGFTLDQATSLPSGHRLEVVLSATITDVGECDNLQAFKVYDKDGNDVSGNYAITLVPGTLTVTPRTVVVTSEDGEWEYDGSSHSKANIAKTDGLVNGHTAIVGDEFAKITDVGTADNEISIIIQSADGEDKTQNYKIVLNVGTLTITRRPITVVSEDGEWEYDGNSHYKNEIKQITSDLDFALVDGHTATVDTADGKYSTITDFGETDNEITVIISDGNNVDKTDNYNITLDAGTLKITQRPITVKAGSAEKIYDGTPLTSDGYEITSMLKLVDGHIGVAECVGTNTDVGPADNEIISFTVYDGEALPQNDVSDNYSITLSSEAGTLTITRRPITVVSEDGEWEYDGNSHYKNEIKQITSDLDFALVDGHTATVDTADGKYSTITDFGETDNEITVIISDGNNVDKTDNYNITLDAGTLKITQRPITVKAGSAEKIYDGTPLKCNSGDFTVTVGEIVDGQLGVAEFTTASERTDYGTADNMIADFSVYSGETNVTRNYKITISDEAGTLTVTKRPIVVTTNDQTWTYDDQNHSHVKLDVTPAAPLDISDFAIVDTQKIVVIDCTTVCDVMFDEDGEVTDTANEVHIKITESDGITDKTANYKIDYANDGRLKIEPRPITVKAGSAEKIYDDTPLTSGDYEITSALKLAEGHTGVAKCSGTITDVGTEDNEIISFKVYKGENASPENEITRNYSITLSSEAGKLTVTKRPIKVTTNSKSWIYDGKTHYYVSYEITPDAPLTESDVAIIDTQRDFVKHYDDGRNHTEVCDVMYDKNGDVTDTPNVIVIQIITASMADKTDNYKINYVYSGRLKIEPRPIKVTTESKEWTYDDTDHDLQKYDVKPREPLLSSDIAIVESQESSVSNYTTVHDVMRDASGNVIGTDNVLKIEIHDGSGADKTGNYDIKYVYGTLTVNPIKLKYISGSAEKYFDGEPLLGSTAHIDGYSDVGAVIVNTQDVLQNHTATVKAVSKLVYPGTVSNNVSLEVKAGGKDVTHNYEPVVEKCGTLTVKKVKITVVTADGKKIYDATPLTSGGNEVIFTAGKYSDASGLPSWFTYAVTVTGSITDVGDAENTASIKITYIKPNASSAVELTEANGADMTAYYDITYDFGTLTVTPRYITVQTGHTQLTDGVNRWEYDGELHSDPYFGVVDGDYSAYPIDEVRETGLIAGHTLSATSEYQVVHAGTYSNKFNMQIENADGEVITRNYRIIYIRGTLEIVARKISVSTATKSWKYDGDPHSDYTLEITSEQGLLDGHSMAASSECTITNVGKKTNQFLVDITDGYGNDVTDDYEIIWDLGTLTIEKSDVGGNEGGNEGGNNSGGTNIGLGEGEGEGEAWLLLTFETDYDGAFYFREVSYGDYNGVGFYGAPEYSVTITDNGIDYSMNYLPSTIMRGIDAKEYYLNVKLEASKYYALPYFTAMGNDGQNQTSDAVNVAPVDSNGNATTEYSVNFCPYMYTSDNGAMVLGKLNASYSQIESDYADFVRKNYLQVPTETLSYLRGIVRENNFDANDPEIVAKVARYIQGSAKYKFNYDKALNSESDKVIAFLRDYKEGICQHYATAATMLFRTLGIPARYTEGIMAYADGSGKPTELMSTNGHAWTEVYIDGVGWVVVEVTGGSDDGGNGGDDGNGGNGGDNGGESGNGSDKKNHLKPVDVYVESGEAMPVNAVVQTNGSWLSDLLNRGYSYDVTVERDGTESVITSFKLYDVRGYDVTPLYADKIDTDTRGKLVTTGKTHVYVQMYYLQKEFDGTPLELNDDDFYVISDGYTVELNIAGIGITDVGVLTTEHLRTLLDAKYGENNWFTVRNSLGVDVTDDCFVILTPELTDDYVAKLRTGKESLVVVEVIQRAIKLKSGTASKVYDGQPLKCEEVIVSDGSLVEGHVLMCEFSSSITDVGKVDNNFTCKIVDADGNDVTKYYKVKGSNGTLTVVE